MTKTISQVHEAAKAFRTQFRPLIEILDEVAELSNLEDARRELEAGISGLKGEQDKLAEMNALASKELNEAQESVKRVKREGELQSQQVAAGIAFAREAAEEEAKRVRAEVSAAIAAQQAAGAAAVAEAEAKVAGLDKEAQVLEARLDMLRKAISSIVVGAGE